MNRPCSIPADVAAELRRVRLARAVHRYCVGASAFAFLVFAGQGLRWVLS